MASSINIEPKGKNSKAAPDSTLMPKVAVGSLGEDTPPTRGSSPVLYTAVGWVAGVFQPGSKKFRCSG